MKKWTYLVAGLLISGTAATFTSCIDTTEPAGITELRGAKADFIRAKAEYERVLVELQKIKVEREKIQLERDKITLQTEQLTYEYEQELNAQKKAEIALQIKLMEKEYERLMLEEDQRIAEAKKLLLEALNALELAQLTDRDNRYQSEISGLRYSIANQINILNYEQDYLNSLEYQKLMFITEHEYYVANWNLQKAKQEKDLEILNTLLANYQAIQEAGVTDISELTKQKADIESQIIKLNEKEEQEWQKYQQMKEGENFVAANNAVQNIILELEKEASFTLPKAEVAENIQESLYNALEWDYNIDKFFNENHDALITDIVLDKDFFNMYSLQYQNLASYLSNVASNIISEGMQEYTESYNDLLKQSYSAEDIFDENYEVRQSFAAKVEAEKNRIASDKDKYQKDYEEALSAWVNSYIEFNKALKAYGGYDTTQPMADMYQIIVDIYELYQESLDPEVDDITLTKAKEWRTTIEGLYKKRASVDGILNDEYEDFVTNYVKDADGNEIMTEENLDSKLPSFINQALNDFLGANWSLQLSASVDYNYEGLSTYQKLLNAYCELFGYVSEPITLDTLTEPILNADGTAPANLEDAIPDNIKPEDYRYSTYSYYWASINFDLVYPGLSAYANWKATYDFIAAAQEKEAAAIAQLEADKEAKVAEYNELFITLWETELKGFLIVGTEGTYGYAWFSPSNPYGQFATGSDIEDGTAIPYNDQTEYAKLQDQLSLLNAAIQNGELSYVIYDPNNGTYDTTNGYSALEYIINMTQQYILDAQQQIENIEFYIARFEESGWDATSGESLDMLQKDIDDQTKVVEEYQQILDMYTSQLQKVLDAYSANSGE